MSATGRTTGPAGIQGENIEDSPFFDPPRAIMLGGLVAFVPRGLTEEQYQEWYSRMTAANCTILEFRRELNVAKGEDMAPESVGMGVKVKEWFENVRDWMCRVACRFWYKGDIVCGKIRK